MTDYTPTTEEVRSIYRKSVSRCAGEGFAEWVRRTNAEFDRCLRQVKAEALREARVSIKWADSVPNDGEYEYTSTSDCDGSNIRYYRRKPKCEGAHHPWEPATQQAWEAARYPDIENGDTND